MEFTRNDTDSSILDEILVTRLPGLMDYQTRETILFVLAPVLSTFISVLGIIGNIFNIILFKRQGLKDSITVSLLALAVSDLATLVCLLWIGVAYNPLVRFHPNVPFRIEEIILVTGSLPRSFFARLSSIITAYISIERCCCVLKPLEVRNIFTRKRFILVIICVCFAIVLTGIPITFSSRLAWKTDPRTNKTYLGLYRLKDRYQFVAVGSFMDMCVAIATLVIVAVCAFILIGALGKRKLWLAVDEKRKDKQRFLSVKDRKAAQTAMLLAVMFIVCYIIKAFIQLAVVLWKDFNRGGRYVNMYFVAVTFGNVLEGVCASGNIFIYIKTNSRFRSQLQSMLGFRCLKEEK